MPHHVITLAASRCLSAALMPWMLVSFAAFHLLTQQCFPFDFMRRCYCCFLCDQRRERGERQSEIQGGSERERARENE